MRVASSRSIGDLTYLSVREQKTAFFNRRFENVMCSITQSNKESSVYIYPFGSPFLWSLIIEEFPREVVVHPSTLTPCTNFKHVTQLFSSRLNTSYSRSYVLCGVPYEETPESDRKNLCCSLVLRLAPILAIAPLRIYVAHFKKPLAGRLR